MSTEQSTESPRRARPAARFALHFLEMVVAMVVGMIVLEPVWSFAWPDLSGVVTAHVLVMATNMSLGMALWMRIRRHGWASIAEMSAAMYLPFLVLLPFYWTGVLPEMGLMAAGHVLMLPAMLAAMLRRRHEYAC
jgi:flagellar biosynthetic protein FliP